MFMQLMMTLGLLIPLPVSQGLGSRRAPVHQLSTLLFNALSFNRAHCSAAQTFRMPPNPLAESEEKARASQAVTNLPGKLN